MKNFLLVDDDETSNFLMSTILRKINGVGEIHTALHGEAAITFLNAGLRPDIILLDLNMPVMNGFGFLEAFEKLRMPGKENIKIAVVTSSPDIRDISRARELGANHYLTKPVTEKTLITLLDL